MTSLPDIVKPFDSNAGMAIPNYTLNVTDVENTKAALFVRPFGADSRLTTVHTDHMLSGIASSTVGRVGYLLDRLKGEVGYIQFLLLQAEMPLQEKYNLVRLAGDQYMVHFTGREPPLFSYGGVLVNALNAYQLHEFVTAYNLFLRASRANRSLSEIVLRYDNIRMSGQMLGLTIGIRGEQQIAASFSFQVLVRKLEIKLDTDLYPASLNFTSVSGVAEATEEAGELATSISLQSSINRGDV